MGGGVPHLVVKRERIQVPMFGLRGWSDADFNVPLTFQFDQATTKLFLAKERLNHKGLIVVLDATLEIHFSSPPAETIKALKSSGKSASELAESIYNYYIETFYQFEAVLLTTGRVLNLSAASRMSKSEFFEDGDFKAVVWTVDGGPENRFKPNLRVRRRLYVLFKAPQLVTPEKWRVMGAALDSGRKPLEDIVILHRLLGRVFPKDKRIPTIEAAILIESILGEYALERLAEIGLSKNKIKGLREELSFNAILNLVLPLTLSKTQAKSIGIALQKVDHLRKIRNDIVHNNLREDKIEIKPVRDGIKAAMRLVSFLQRVRTMSKP
jgi:hypothetical protein